MRAEAAGDPGHGGSSDPGSWDWDADALRDIVRDYVIEHLADDDAVLVIDETGFLTGQSVMRSGAAIHWFGREDTNCQIGVFATYVSRHGHAFIDRTLYLPKEWTDDPDRLEAATCPRCRLCDQTKACDENDRTRHSRVCTIQVGCCDTVYGVGDIEQQLRQQAKLCTRVSSAHVFRSWGKRPPVAVRRRDRPDAALIRLERLSAGAEPKDHGCTIGVISNWPISRPSNSTVLMMVCGPRSADPASYADAISLLHHWCPAERPSKRWWRSKPSMAIEDSFEPRKTSSGSITTRAIWHGWHRHVPVMLAFA